MSFLPAFASPDALLSELALALGREGPHTSLILLLLEGLERWADPRLERELLLLLQEVRPRVGEPPALLLRLKRRLEALLPDLSSDLQPYAPWLLACLRADAAWADLLAHDAGSESERPPQIFAEPLFALLLTRCYCCDAWLEALLTRLRRRLLLAYSPPAQAALGLPTWEAALLLLAQQAWQNGYVWDLDAEEAEGLARIEARLSSLAEPGSRAGLESGLALLRACYAPLWAAHAPMPPAWQGLVNLSLRQPAQERALAEALETLTPLDPEDPCLSFYAETPYPRWLAPETLAVEPLHEQLDAIFAGQAPAERLVPGADVLIAGCGTGQQLLQQMLQWPAARYTAIDLSRPALAHTARMLAALGVQARLAQADLSRLEALPWAERFALIACGGVLHHLAAPEAGLASLVRLLAPGGLLKLGVYSRRARAPVMRLRELLGIRGGEGPAAVRDLRRRLLRARKDPAASPELIALAGWATTTRDFWTLAGCRDLLCHPREQGFELPELQSWFTRLGLEVLGPELWNPADYARYRWRGEGAGLGDLAAWDALEAEQPSLFAGMIVLWLRKR